MGVYGRRGTPRAHPHNPRNALELLQAANDDGPGDQVPGAALLAPSGRSLVLVDLRVDVVPVLRARTRVHRAHERLVAGAGAAGDGGGPVHDGVAAAGDELDRRDDALGERHVEAEGAGRPAGHAGDAAGALRIERHVRAVGVDVGVGAGSEQRVGGLAADRAGVARSSRSLR